VLEVHFKASKILTLLARSAGVNNAGFTGGVFKVVKLQISLSA
jgi:hypothetical protein